MAPKVRLFYHPVSHYCVSAERMLRFKRIKFETVRVPYHDRTQLLKETKQDFIPALLWGRQLVTWKKIPSFLDAQVPSPALYPAKDPALAVVLENWGHQVVEERVWRAVVTQLGPAFPTAAERWTFEEIQDRARGPWHVLQARRKEFEQQMREYLEMIDAMLDDRDWLLGDPSLADFGVYGGLSPLFAAGGRVPSELGNLNRWARRIASL